MRPRRSDVNQRRTIRWLFHWLALRAGGKTLSKSWWAREDSNLQPDRYERSALTIELRARLAPALRQQPRHPSPLTTAAVARQSHAHGVRTARETRRRYSRNSRVALPL